MAGSAPRGRSPEEDERHGRALRESKMYRADQHTYLLYPRQEPRSFMARNTVPDEKIAAIPLL